MRGMERLAAGRVTFLRMRRDVAVQTGKATVRVPLSFASEAKLQPARRVHVATFRGKVSTWMWAYAS